MKWSGIKPCIECKTNTDDWRCQSCKDKSEPFDEYYRRITIPPLEFPMQIHMTTCRCMYCKPEMSMMNQMLVGGIIGAIILLISQLIQELAMVHYIFMFFIVVGAVRHAEWLVNRTNRVKNWILQKYWTKRVELHFIAGEVP